MGHAMQKWQEIILVLLILVSATALIAVTEADMMVASHFYQSNGWPIGEQFPWKLFYRLDRYPAFSLAILGLFAVCYGSFKPKWRSWRRQGAFVVLLLALGPGLMVNAIFKDHWGRPRPREVVQFGGTKAFLQPWQPGTDGRGRSFPCGHASAAFYMMAPYFIYRRFRNRQHIAKRWLLGGILFGLLMGYARLSQGGHFLSDILWAWGMVWLTALILASYLLPEEEHNANVLSVSC
jgi:membrane-associated PAP2 superfamily phosphatase